MRIKGSPKKPRQETGSQGFFTKKSFMERIVHAMSDGVAVINSKGSIEMVNQALCDILGYPKSQMLHKGWGELFFAEVENQDFNQTIVEVIQTHNPIINREVRYLGPDKKLKDLIATTSVIRENQAIVGLVALFKDITELNQVHHREKQLMRRSRRLFEEKQEGLDRVARAVAHEIRNPVTAIGGLAARLLKKTGPDDKAAQYLQRILESTGRLEEVVAQVQGYSYLPHPVRRPIDASQWLTGVVAGYADRAKRAGVELVVSTATGGSNALWDPALMTAAIKNIMDNAMEAMPNGGSLKVSLKARGQWFVMKISDQGTGISPHDMPYLFDPFFTTKADRVGMSLAITERIITEHEGTIRARSSLGEGTKIIIVLPQGTVVDSQAFRQPQPK